MPGHRFDQVIRLAGLEEPGDDGVTKVVEAQAGAAHRMQFEVRFDLPQ